MVIQSASNPHIKYIRNLYTQRKARRASREFVVEGVQAVSRAFEGGWHVKRLVYSPNDVRSDWGKRTVAASDPKMHVQVTSSLLRKLSEREDTELIAVVSQAEDDFARISIRPELLVVVIEHPQNPGNLGTIIRTSDAMGVHGILIVEPAVDVYDPKAVRATMGSLFTLPVLRVPTPEALRGWLNAVRQTLDGMQVVGTSPYDAVPAYSCRFRRPTALIIGNEQAGMSEAAKELCDAMVCIPMSGAAESLNSAISAAMLLYEIRRQRDWRQSDL